MASRPVALVTGAARRLGRAIALELGAHGWDIAVHYHASVGDAHDTVAALGSAGAGAQAFGADLADETACRALLPAVATHFGRVDAVVNNASIFEYDDAAGFGHAAMERHWRANTAPAVLLAQALHAHLQGSERSGCVVNLTDQKLWNPNPDYFSYTLSKAALDAATTLLALSLAPRVRVAAVAPGVTLVSGPMSEAELARAKHLTPLQRSSNADDIARAVRFILESPAITGTTLLIDGGQHLARQPRDVLFLTKDTNE
jgi:NAD(P)-dependent dehydrogenase (short-subunit alcohol dehydrogenase family)